MSTRKGKNVVRDAIAKAPTVRRVGPAPAGKLAAPDFIAGRFEMRATGLWRIARTDREADLWLASPFEVLAQTRDATGTNWGLWLRWNDSDGRRHDTAMPHYQLTGEGAEVRSRLADGGLRVSSVRQARDGLIEYLNVCAPSARAQCVQTIGWHSVDGKRVFVLPARTFGTASEQVIFQPNEATPDPFACGGTLEDWRTKVAALCAGNTRLLFAVSCAFAGPLLELVGDLGGGFNLRGPSRIGKSTALRVASSVWGGTQDKGADGYVNQWRATDNALESTAAARSDTLLCLDEMGQVDARFIGEAVYMIANGSGKLRSRRDGIARPAARFRVLFLSTGEVGLADKIAEAGKPIRAGQEVRLIDLRADAGAGLGLFGNLHGSHTPGAFAERLAEATGRHFGTPAVAFLKHLLAALDLDPTGLPQQMRDRVAAYTHNWTSPYPNAGGQVRSVARRFALAAVAGEMASEARITGWATGYAADAASEYFSTWLADRGSTGAREDAQAISRVQSFIARHGDSRFDDWGDVPIADRQQSDPDANPPRQRFRTPNRAGWRKWVAEPEGGHGWRYFLTSDAMREALGGLDIRNSNRALVEAGYLIADAAGKSMRAVTPPGHKKARLYEITGAILGAEDGEGQ